MKKDHFENIEAITTVETITPPDLNEPEELDDIRHLDILVIEDNFADYDDICRFLRRMTSFTVSVVCARNLEEARHALKKQSFDIALVDYCLGAESGARFLHETGGRGGAVASILLTGLITKEPQEIAMQAGAVGCLNKDDLSPRLLETTIRYSLYTHTLERKFRDVVDQMTSATSETQKLC